MILERTAIYERDRLDPVEPSEAFDKLFKAADLAVYPEAYRYMAARLVAAGRALAGRWFTTTARPTPISSAPATMGGLPASDAAHNIVPSARPGRIWSYLHATNLA